ncbi:MAG: DUF2844 domain-containing protein [Terriglobales bacterium]|jgi:hypothetical protein
MKVLVFSLAVVVSLFSSFSSRAFGALGGDVASVAADRAQMKAGDVQKQTSSYAVHELQGESGTVVREYVSPSGNVFAVAWQGQFFPDMQELLGTYFDQYSAAVKANKEARVGRRPLNVQLPGLTVQLNGHMRAYHFRAYVPQQVPAGVKQEGLW